jgi:hypothetical protein
VGKTWNDVIPAPAAPLLDTPVVGTASDIGSVTFTANWTAVANATGYKVYVFEGANLISIYKVSGQATTSVLVTGLAPEKTYTYKVLALGDGYVNYSDSYLSGASAAVETSITSGTEITPDFKLTVSGKSIVASEAGTFELYNLQGARVYQLKNADVAETALPAGLYILRFTHSNSKQTIQKILIN